VSEDKKSLGSASVLVAILVAIVLVVFFVGPGFTGEEVSDSAVLSDKKAVLERIKPIGVVATTDAEAQEASPEIAEPVLVVEAGPLTGDKIYNTTCFACHGAGIAGAPKFGDVASWAPRIQQGFDVLFEHAVKGFKGMPPRGGSGQLTDDNIKVAVEYMVEKSQ